MKKVIAAFIGLLPSSVFTICLIREPLIATALYFTIGIIAVSFATTQLSIFKQIGFAFMISCLLILYWMVVIGPTPDSAILSLFTAGIWILVWLPLVLVLIVISNFTYKYSYKYLHV